VRRENHRKRPSRPMWRLGAKAGGWGGRRSTARLPASQQQQQQLPLKQQIPRHHVSTWLTLSSSSSSSSASFASAASWSRLQLLHSLPHRDPSRSFAPKPLLWWSSHAVRGRFNNSYNDPDRSFWLDATPAIGTSAAAAAAAVAAGPVVVAR